MVRVEDSRLGLTSARTLTIQIPTWTWTCIACIEGQGRIRFRPRQDALDLRVRPLVTGSRSRQDDQSLDNTLLRISRTFDMPPCTESLSGAGVAVTEGRASRD